MAELEIYMMPESTSILEHCVVEYGGSEGSNVHLDRIGATISKSTIRYSGGAGISFEGLANLSFAGLISGNTLTENSTYGIYSMDVGSVPEIVQNTVTNNGSYPVRVGPMAELSDNTFLGNQIQAIELLPGEISGNVTWKNNGIDYIATGDVTVHQTSPDLLPTLTVEPGVTVRFEAGTGLMVGDESGAGLLSARGAEGAPVIFTSNAATPAPGDWKGVIFNELVGFHLATGGSCASSDCNSYPTYGCEKAFDGNLGTYFHTLSLPTHWIGYDFGPDKAHKVRKLRFYPLSGFGVKNFLIEGSNSLETDWEEKSWTTLAGVYDGHEGWNSIEFANETPYRFIRLVSTGGYNRPDYFPVAELEIYMMPESTSILEHCVVEYGGSEGSNVHLDRIGVTISNSIIRYSEGSGISFEGLANLSSAGLISGNTLTDNSTYGIYSMDVGSAPDIVQNTVTNNGSYPVRVGPMVELSGNTFLGNQIQAIELFPGEISRDVTWKNNGIDYIATGDVTVRQTSPDLLPTLTVEPGVTVRFEPGTALFVGDESGAGVLSARGNEEAPVIFTSNAATPAPGDWKGIVINELVGFHLATGGSCASSDCNNYSLYGCEKAFDGNLATYFHTLSLPTHWIGYDFGPDKAHEIRKLRFYPHDGFGVKELVIEGSNGLETDWEQKGWTTLATVDDGHEGWNGIGFANDTPYRFIRLISTGGYTYPSYFPLYELEMYVATEDISIIEHCTVEYGGHTDNANISINNAKPVIRFSAFRKSSGSGVYLNGSQCTAAVVECNDIEENLYGVYITGEAYPHIADNNFSGNLTHGLHTDITRPLTAANNWWGDPNGPNQSGDTIFGNVDFEPWLTQKNDCLFDKTPPQLMETVPVGGAALFHVEQVTVTLFEFQSDVDDGAVIGSFSVRNGSSEAVPGTVSEANDLFTFVPETAPLADGVYQVSFTSVDTRGNSQAHAFSFTVESDLDTDGDGLPDWWEQEHFGSLDAGGADDPDNDRLGNLQEYTISADPNAYDPDNDDDAVPDWWELEQFGNLSEERAGDADNDGFSNLTEYKTGTIPTDADSKPAPGRYLEYDTHGRIKEIVVIKPSS